MKPLEFGTFQNWVIERGVGCRMRIRYWCQMLMTIHMCNLHKHHRTWIDMNLYIDAHDEISWLWPVSTSIFLHSTSDHHFPIFPTFLPTNKPGSLITVFPSQGVDKVFPPGIFLCLSYRSVCLSRWTRHIDNIETRKRSDVMFPPSNPKHIIEYIHVCSPNTLIIFNLTDCFLEETEDMLLVQHDLDAFADGIQTLSICFSTLFFNAKNTSTYMLWDEIRKKTSIWEDKLSVCLHIYKLELLKKSSILGDVPIAVCSLYIFPPYVPIQRPQKRSTFCLFPPPEEVHQSTLCRWPRTSTCWHPKPRFFWNHKQLADRRVPENPGKKNMETSKEDEHLKNGVFFFGVFLFWKLEAIGKKTVKPGYTGYTHSDSDECSHFLLVLFVEISDVVRHGEQNYRWESLNTSFDSKKISNNRQ